MNETEINLPILMDGEDKSSSLINCIRNQYRHIRKWAKRTQTNCFRLYDRQIHQYPLAIDFYDGRFCVHYFSRESDQNNIPLELKEEVERVLIKLFATQPTSIYWRTRAKTKATRQYEKIDAQQDFFTVVEYGVKFKINLVDYLDTGLFLDHRETRRFIASIAKNKRLLNLFAYTCSFSVHAAAAGARLTKSVDMSNTYTEWGRDNFILNRLSLKNNEIVRADCLPFLEQEVRSKALYDIIVIDPPTISRSKKMTQLFDVQQDYIYLIQQSLCLLDKDGVIFFSTNSRKFVFDEQLFPHCQILDVSAKTLPIDFHDPKIHRCWRITVR